MPRQVRDGFDAWIMGVVATTRVRGWEVADAAADAAAAAAMTVEGRGGAMVGSFVSVEGRGAS